MNVMNIGNTSTGRTFSETARRLGSKWKLGDQNARPVPGGGMLSLGVSKGSGDEEYMYNEPTNSDRLNKKKNKWTGINLLHKRLNVLGGKLSRRHFPTAFRSIKKACRNNKLKVPNFLGGKRGLSPQLIQSGHGFYSESHFDFDISEYCLSIWNSEDGSDPEGWYFILPNLSGVLNDGTKYSGVAIRLRDGTGIEWNGRMLHHCTSPPRNMINVFGTFFALIKV